MSDNTYTVDVTCHNCDYTGEVCIPKGIEYNNHNPVCPNCGCKTLRKQIKTWVSLEDKIIIDKWKNKPYLHDIHLCSDLK